MSETYDVVTIGSGHNGLVAAAYLAAAGKRTLVLERNAWFGGGVVTRELTVPGFRHDQHSMAHIFIQANPLLADDELGLKARHGLKYVFPELPMMSVFEDGATRRRPRCGDRVRGSRHRLRQARCRAMMTLYSADKTALMQIQAIERSGEELLIKGKVFRTMPMTARLTPAEARNGLRLLSLRLVLFLVSMPFRRK